MNYATTLDIRNIADDWQEFLAEYEDNGEVATTDEVAKYVELCQELGCDETPNDLLRYSDDYETTMILESDFQDYAQELAEELGLIPSDLSWPLTCIDWEYAARELAHDYTSVTFDGESYYIRSC